jgi:hypothetical protein
MFLLLNKIKCKATQNKNNLNSIRRKILLDDLIKARLNILSESNQNIYKTNKYSISKEEMEKLKEKPEEPDNDECCGSGCRVCIYDVHETKKIEYLMMLNSLQNRILLDITDCSL